MRQEAYFCTIEELNSLGKENIPQQLISHTHLIYSSPATLAFNSPGAEGFGVKRAGLAVPGSIMLIVAPGCCGRNTSVLSSMRAYHDRFYYLLMDETDIVTGRHLKKIPKAVAEICEGLEKKPSVVMICITCVDALLGTDMERVCRKAEEVAGLPVKPCYMYALTREGRKPPMVHVRQSIYSLLEPKKKKGTVVNLLGYFSPLVDDCELYDLLHDAGVKTIHEISRCKDYAEYQTMSEANFNLVLHPEARFAAEDFHDRLKIPYIELRRLYQIDKIASQYRAFGAALGVTFDDEKPRRAAENAVAKFKEKHPEASFAVGEWMNGDPFELALALVRYGFRVPEIYGTLSGENFIYVKQLAALSPETKVFSNLEPTMLYYDGTDSGVTLTIGKDAGYYHKNCPNVLWNGERQPYGYAGVRRLFEALTVDTDGMELYDKGEEKAWQELFRVFAGEKEDVIPGNIGILGMTPQDISDLRAADRIREHFAAEGKTAICYGMGNGLDDVKCASNVEKHIVVAPAALEAAKYLERTYGTPYEIGYPLVDELVSDLDYSGKKVLVVQQQVMGTAIREEILKQAPDAQVTVASWFMMKPELRQEGDLHLRDEDDYVELVEKGGFDVIYADHCMERMTPKFAGIFVDTVHFAVSGRLA